MPNKASPEVEQLVVNTFSTCKTVVETVRALSGVVGQLVVRRVLHERGLYNGRTYKKRSAKQTVRQTAAAPSPEPQNLHVDTDVMIGAYLASPIGTTRAVRLLSDVLDRFDEITR